MDSPQLIGSEPPPLWGFRILRGSSMFELGKTRRRVDTLERETVPKLMEEMRGMRLSIEKISSQLSRLVVLVAISGALGSPEAVRGMLSSVHHFSGLSIGYEVKSIVR